MFGLNHNPTTLAFCNEVVLFATTCSVSFNIRSFIRFITIKSLLKKTLVFVKLGKKVFKGWLPAEYFTATNNSYVFFRSNRLTANWNKNILTIDYNKKTQPRVMETEAKKQQLSKRTLWQFLFKKAKKSKEPLECANYGRLRGKQYCDLDKVRS